MSIAEPTVTETFTPGIYDMPEDIYHRDPVPGGSLSSTEVKRLLKSPAHYRWHKDNGGQDHKDVFDFGRAAHAHVLGAGGPVTILKFDNYKTKAAREARDEARSAGITPVLASAWAPIEAMGAQVRRHPVAAALLDPDGGEPEQSLFWQADIWRRARADFLTEPTSARRRIVVEYKTTTDASVGGMSRSIASFGYHISAAYYLDGVRRLTGDDDTTLVLIAQEKEPPYLVNVMQLTDYALRIGEHAAERGVRRYIACTESEEWPGYAVDVDQVGLPRWAEIEHEEMLAMESEGAPSW